MKLFLKQNRLFESEGFPADELNAIADKELSSTYQPEVAYAYAKADQQALVVLRFDGNHSLDRGAIFIAYTRNNFCKIEDDVKYLNRIFNQSNVELEDRKLDNIYGNIINKSCAKFVYHNQDDFYTFTDVQVIVYGADDDQALFQLKSFLLKDVNNYTIDSIVKDLDGEIMSLSEFVDKYCTGGLHESINRRYRSKRSRRINNLKNKNE